MGSKKHKKESKKKKHRSRSRSPLEGEEVRERKRHHKKHKDRKKDRSPDVEEVPVDSHLLPPAPARRSSSAERAQRERDRSARDARSRATSNGDLYHPEPSSSSSYRRDSPPSAQVQHRESAPRQREPPPSYANEKAPDASGGGGGGQESLSIEETNRLRAKLGLKPLEVAEQTAEDGKITDDLGEFYHRPAANIAAQKKGEKIKQKLDERREKRKIDQKLQATVTLAEGSDDEDALAWVRKSRDIEKQKKEAAKRAAMLDEMDAVFGVSALVAQEEQADRAARYGSAHLHGLRVAHDLNDLGDERDTVLTLADKEVLAEDAEDVLVNVNILDQEKYKKNQEERKKAAAGYQAYDDEAALAAMMEGAEYSRPLLAKYDAEIDHGAEGRRRGFLIGDDKGLQAQRARDMMRAAQAAGGPDRRLESLALPPLRPATQYYDEAEIQAKFKKTKKRGKIRKKAKEEPIDVDDYDAAAAPLQTDDTEVKPEQLAAPPVVEEEEVEVDSELQIALARARRLRQMERAREPAPKVEDLLQRVKEEGGVEADAEAPEAEGGAMVLDATAEFCRTLGDIPTYGQAGNRDHHSEIMDFEHEDLEPEPVAEAGAGGAWSRVDVQHEKPPDISAGSTVVLEPEPALGAGVAGALQLALSKGYLERAGSAPAPRPASQHALAARHYSIEDKAHGGGGAAGTGEEERHGRRERHTHHHGPLGEFREKPGFRPKVKLEYVDDDGHALCPKEAFRYLSHKFHGKGPGKNKQEKRIKKQIQEGLMKKMSSTDTPLGTLQMLQDKQRETHSPYVVLSGGKRDNNAR